MGTGEKKARQQRLFRKNRAILFFLLTGNRIYG